MVRLAVSVDCSGGHGIDSESLKRLSSRAPQHQPTIDLLLHLFFQRLAKHHDNVDASATDGFSCFLSYRQRAPAGLTGASHSFSFPVAMLLIMDSVNDADGHAKSRVPINALKVGDIPGRSSTDLGAIGEGQGSPPPRKGFSWIFST